jgi:hypothetical protein
MRSIDIKEAWLEDEMATRLSLRAKFNCSDSYIRNALEKEGIDSADIYRRESRVMHQKVCIALNVDEITSINKCLQCCIIMIDNPLFIPDGWQWVNNGRRGDLCNGCCIEMRKEHRMRMDALVNFGCIVCRRETMAFNDAEVHHLRNGRGIGQKKDHDKTIPLCPSHHRTGGYGIAFHAGQAEWELRHGNEISLLNEVDKMLLTLYVEL